MKYRDKKKTKLNPEGNTKVVDTTEKRNKILVRKGWAFNRLMWRITEYGSAMPVSILVCVRMLSTDG